MSTAADGQAYVQREIDAMLSACTRCGRCVEVCPVVPHGRARDALPADVVTDVLRLLADGTPPWAAASDWVHGCNGCGDCIAACPEGVNPRNMLQLAAMRDASIASRTPQLFRRMARSIRLMVAMQLLPADYARLLVPTRPRPAELVFYLGCNALRTPNLLLNTMELLDALEADYEVVGGPSSCCGVIASKWEGQMQAGTRVTESTLTRFEGFQAPKVLNWCPTCDLHLNETMGRLRPRAFEFDHVTAWLLERADALRACFVQPVPRRVVLHAHRGVPEVGQNVEQLLRAIPGLEVVETVLESSYTCGGSGCSKTPDLRELEHAHLLERVRATGADALVTLYHGCHMAFVGHEKEGEFEVLNFTDLLVQALGRPTHPDHIKSYKMMDDWQAIVAEAQPWLRRNGLDVDSAWLEQHGAEILAVSEFKGGLDCLAAETPLRRAAPPAAAPVSASAP